MNVEPGLFCDRITQSRNLGLSLRGKKGKKAKMPFASRPSAPVEAPSNGTTSATGRRAQRNSAVETDASVTTITHMVHTGQDLRRRIIT